MNMQTSASANQYQLSQTLQLYCDQHKSELLTNFCSHPSCLRPLCPDCIDTHNKFHKQSRSFAEIDSIKNIKIGCQKKLKTGILEIQRILDDLEASMSLIEGDDLPFQQLRRAKEQVIEVVNQYFNSLEDQYRQTSEQNNEKQTSINAMLESLHQNLNEFEFLSVNLEEVNTINTIKRVCVLDVKKTIERYRKQWKQTEQLKNSGMVQVQIDQRYLDALIQDISKYAFLSAPAQVVTEPSHIVAQQQVQSVYSPIVDTRQYQSQINNQPDNDYVQYLRVNPTLEPSCQQRYLHFFQSGENNLHLFDLVKQDKWMKFTVISQLPIPSFSKSITTSKGDIYLIGGSLQQGQKSASIFSLDLRSIALTEVCKLQVPRSSHALVELPQGIAIVGGYSYGQMVIDQCELFDMRSVRPFGKLNFPVASPGLCTFREQSLLKLGGIDSKLQICNQIELFQGSGWQTLRLQNFGNQQMTTMCCCVQIDLSEVIIFGGYNEVDQGYFCSIWIGSNVCFSFSVENGVALFNQGMPQLPFAEGFWNNNPTIEDGKIYALQNTTDDQGETCLESERQILIFDGGVWKCL